jgi:hypothetical protein
LGGEAAVRSPRIQASVFVADQNAPLSRVTVAVVAAVIAIRVTSTAVDIDAIKSPTIVAIACRVAIGIACRVTGGRTTGTWPSKTISKLRVRRSACSARSGTGDARRMTRATGSRTSDARTRTTDTRRRTTDTRRRTTDTRRRTSEARRRTTDRRRRGWLGGRIFQRENGAAEHCARGQGQQGLPYHRVFSFDLGFAAGLSTRPFTQPL